MGIRSRAYGEMAMNLAISLKAFLPDFPLCGISDGSIESAGDFKKVFNSIVTVPRGANPFELKTRLNEFSPFKRTLYVDADSIFLSSPEKLFKELENVKFAIMNYGTHKADSKGGPIWATCEEIFFHYAIPSDALYPEYNSSVIFWEKNKANTKYWKAVHANYLKPKPKLIQDVGGFLPDEIPFGVASAMLNHHSELDRWQPAFLQWEKRVTPEKEIFENYCLLTRAGSRIDQYIDRIYHASAKKAGKKIGMETFTFNIKNKIHGKLN